MFTNFTKHANPLSLFNFNKNNDKNTNDKNTNDKNTNDKNFMGDGTDIKWEDTIEFTFPKITR